MRLLRDFVEFVREFRRIEAREAEAALRSNADAVAILTVHKAKGLEFPIVIVPDLQREFPRVSAEVLFDREKGLAFKVPDGRGGLARTRLYETIATRKELRERFESMRLLFVAATRAEDMLILSGAASRKWRRETSPLRECGSWLEWVARIHGVENTDVAQVVDLGSAQVRLTGPNLGPSVPVQSPPVTEPAAGTASPSGAPNGFAAVERVRRLLGEVVPGDEASLRRFSATELQSYANCPRQYYYGRLLRIPSPEARRGHQPTLEAASGTSRLPAALSGIIVHRFCETYQPGEAIEDRLLACVREVRTARGDDFAGVLESVEEGAALAEVTAFARNYIDSPMRLRIEERLGAGRVLPTGEHEFVRSELPFTFRTRHGFIAGAIDKVLLTPLASGRIRASIVDFKTGRIGGEGAGLKAAVERAAAEHQLQMQIYAQAVRRLLPGVGAVEATLHFLEPGPNVEFEFRAEMIGELGAGQAIERVLADIVSGGYDPVAFSAQPGRRCLTCRFRGLCPDSIAANRDSGAPNGPGASTDHELLQSHGVR
jgi:ATP-dependent exoDNAse (exonuclease V) beta subunit